ncbi:DNA primase family protein [Microbacterium halotolerans]|uniref:DNA primase family protein n=1 Tax=Microbacterium halotolerans TaxID=246613 RepID=UPI000E6ABDFD|nr:phage/plasmid primase, P4 family [Microbacterium halotolerans]
MSDAMFSDLETWDQSLSDLDELTDSAPPEDLRAFAGLLRSHARIAYLAAADCVGRFLHVAGLGWYQWNGRCFVPDLEDKAVTRAVTSVVRKLAPDALTDKELLADLTKSQTSTGVAGVVRLMSTIKHLTAEPQELDADPWLLNTPTGVLDLRELEDGVDWPSLTVHLHDPSFRMTQITNAEYDPAAHSSLWDRFVSRSLPDEDVRAFLQTAAGVCLIGEQPEHFLPILTGAGRNGKGVFYGTIRHALGSYAAVASPNLFNVDRHATADKPNPALLALKGRRIVFMSETAKSAEMDAAKIKALTGGDPIKARGVHSKTLVEFTPSHQLLLITNHAPQLPADDPAVWERVRLVPWDIVVPPHERDPRLEGKLTKEVDAVLAWALAGLQRYVREGLTAPDRVAEATEAYKSDQDTVSTFIRERCEDGCSDHHSDAVKTLHADYLRYCRANGVMREHTLGQRDFGTRLTELGYPTKRTGSRRFRQGLRLLPDDDEARATERAMETASNVAHTYQDGAPCVIERAGTEQAQQEPSDHNNDAELQRGRMATAEHDQQPPEGDNRKADVIEAWAAAAEHDYGLLDADHVAAMTNGMPHFHKCDRCLEAAEAWIKERGPLPPCLAGDTHPAKTIAREFERHLRKTGFFDPTH